MKESEKRDFVTQMIKLVTEEKENLSNEGWTADERLAALVEKNEACENAEIAQQEAQAQAMKATSTANQTLTEAYKAASNMADTISGLLGKESEIVRKMRKFRN